MNASSAQTTRPDPNALRSRDAFVYDLANHLQTLLTRIFAQTRHGWDINVILQLHGELGQLYAACEEHGQHPIGEQLLAIKTALAPATIGLRLPDTGTNALIAALASHLRLLTPDLRSSESASHPANVANIAAPTQRVLIASLHAQRACDTAAALTAAGFLVRVLDEPLATLEELSRFAPHCIVLDRQMPLYDGAELAQMIHERADFAQLPVLLLDDDRNAINHHDILPAAALPAQLVTRVQQLINAASDSHVEPERRTGHYRRAWLLDRLDAVLRQGATLRVSGVLDIGIDEASALHKRHGVSALTAIHEQLGALLTTGLDGSDILAENGVGYLLLSRMRDADHLRALADELHAKVRNERYGPSTLPISVTIGGCHLDGGPDSVDAVLSAAQRARTTAPAGGSGWHQGERHRVEPAKLRDALDQGRLHLVYQAIVRTDTNPAPHYQALLRMRDDDGYVRSAAELLPVAHQAGLDFAIDGWVLNHALALLASYQRQMRPLQLFVNQSCASLRQGNYVAWLSERMHHHGVHGVRLILTFEAADIGTAPADLIAASARIRALGVGLCLAGVEHNRACGTLLDTLPLDFIKLAPATAARPGALVPMAHARKIAVIAPQIEDQAIIAQLRKLGVDYAQGHALAHPSRTLNYPFNANSAHA